MNLWFRLFWLLFSARLRSVLILPGDASQLNFRVWPHDLDISVHMNNGRYLELMDLGRTDIMLRSGLWREVWKNKWTPIASAVSIRFRRELRPFQKFQLETRLVCWEAALVVMEQTFVIKGGPRDGQIAARALFKGGLYDRGSKAFVPTQQLMQMIGVSAVSPVPTAEVEAFLRADDKNKTATSPQSDVEA
jgi:acyl-CoA thioesterase FadM